MANILKPLDINKIWSASGDILPPSDTKIDQGWEVEIPPRQYFNYIDNKQDQAIAHINQHGIAIWDNQTEYQIGTSYCQGSDGAIYKAVATSTGINPTTDTTKTYWVKAFLNAADFIGSKQSLGPAGFQYLPGGLIRQWGIVNISGGAFNLPFPIAFPNACVNVHCSESSAGGWGSGLTAPTIHGVQSVTRTGCVLRMSTWLGSGWGISGSSASYWEALGY